MIYLSKISFHHFISVTSIIPPLIKKCFNPKTQNQLGYHARTFHCIQIRNVIRSIYVRIRNYSRNFCHLSSWMGGALAKTNYFVCWHAKPHQLTNNSEQFIEDGVGKLSLYTGVDGSVPFPLYFPPRINYSLYQVILQLPCSRLRLTHRWFDDTANLRSYRVYIILPLLTCNKTI